MKRPFTNTPYNPFAVARLDGVLMYHKVLAGVMKTGTTHSPIVQFQVMAGVQRHPVWALDDLAKQIYAYCLTAREAGVSDTHLQINMAGTWVSTTSFSNILASNIEWHVSSVLREKAERLYAELKNGRIAEWPPELLTLPVSSNGSSVGHEE